MQYNKINNLKIATDKLNRVVIKPGETFSLTGLCLLEAALPVLITI
ncbi:MAG: VanW family protein [Dethiobacter sp.]|nr:VanW family protein [Dethiobacter sp.]